MDNTLNSLRMEKPIRAATSPSRRSFLQYLTLSTAAFAVEGCGGGTGNNAAVTPAPAPTPNAPVTATPAPLPTSPVSTPAPVAPVLLSIPTIAFTQGTPSSFFVGDYISVANTVIFSLSLNEAPLPAGITFNAAARSFDYDGRGAVAATDGHILTVGV